MFKKRQAGITASWLDRSASNNNNLRGASGIAVALKAVTFAVKVGAFSLAYIIATVVVKAQLRCRHSSLCVHAGIEHTLAHAKIWLISRKINQNIILSYKHQPIQRQNLSY